MKSGSLPERVISIIRQKNLFKPGDTVIMAYSGGADSTALLHILCSLPGFPLRIIAAHLNHGLRGAESDADEEFCRETALSAGITFESRRINAAAIAEEHSSNLEEAGRQARIVFFNELRNKWNAAAVVLAHHADDQAETVLMRLLRGAGTTGLAGMSITNESAFVRPLLSISRAEIRAYLGYSNLSWREDSSNENVKLLRNRIRHELLPLLETYNPSVRNSLVASAKLLGMENNLLEVMATTEFNRLATCTADSTYLEIADLKRLHPALLNRILRQAVSSIAGDLRHLTHKHVTDLGGLLKDGRPNRRLSLSGLILARREYERLVICRKSAVELASPEKIDVDGPGEYQLWDRWSMLIENISAVPDNMKGTAGDTAYFDLAAAPFPWSVRTFHPGDQMVPLGMTGRKKLKRIFIDAKTPPLERSRIPLLLSQQTILWLCGLTVSSHASITNESSKIVRASLLKTR